MEKIKIAIGAPTYNDSKRIQNLFTSIMTLTDYPENEYKLVMLDDGTKDKTKKDELINFSKEFNIPLIDNIVNRGIPYSWNKLTEFYDAEYVILFNDDILINSSNWLKNFMYFMENNKHVANIGFPLIHIDHETKKRNEQYSLPDETCNPGKVGCPVGCSFGFRKELWSKIKQPDGSIGFWNDLISFYEEVDFGFEMYKQGYACYMLPTPSVEHCGSRTFAENINLSVRNIGEYLSKKEYLKIIKKAEKLSIPYEKHEEIAIKNNWAFRMDYSRVMFAKKWECKDFWNIPQVEVHKKIVDSFEPKLTKWIDKEGNKREAIL